MKKNLIIDKVTSYHIDTLQSFTEPRLYNTTEELIYEGQTPHAGYLLVEGEIHFIKRKSVFQKILPGTLFGVTELMNHTPIKFTVRILPGSKVCILDKSTVKEILESFEQENLPGALRLLSADVS
jgi:CRP-like cAMP-binding protein